MKKAPWKTLLISLALSLGTGAAAGLLSAGSMAQYENMYRPPLSPPGWVFPLVWTILYVLMGIAAWLVYNSGSPDSKNALKTYVLQLLVNALWPILYFRFDLPLAALACLIFLWYLVYITMQSFGKISPAAGKLMIPYLLWLTFALYLNLAIVLYYV
mgnify:CR=1 FL=1